MRKLDYWSTDTKMGNESWLIPFLLIPKSNSDASTEACDDKLSQSLQRNLQSPPRASKNSNLTHVGLQLEVSSVASFLGFYLLSLCF